MTSVSDNRITHPAPHRTHTVLNQSVPRADVNEFTLDTVLSEGVRRHDADWATAELTDIGSLVGSATFQHDAELANTVIPELKTFDRWGNRIDEVEYHPAYHRIISAAVAHGAHTSAWADPKPGANVARAAAFMMFAQIEPGHSCPISMTNAVVPSLELQPDVAAIWKPRALSRSYTPELDAPGKASAIFGMSMTEKQGGSDVRANTTVAKPAGRGGPGADYLLTGHKWFCSAPMSDAFLVLAQAEGEGGEGLSCFLLPRILPDGTRNVFRIQRLKNKLGNKSNASSEIELDGTVGVMVGEPGRGVRTIIEMVARTRLDCVLGSAAGMRQSVAEAVWHARHRSAFGAVLADQPAMTSVLADLALESEAATVTALRLARAHDADASEQERSFRRLATAVAKYWICKRGPHHAYEALECLGGNGYTEDFPLARRYREQPVMAVWEGSGNVIALDVLRAMTREPDTVAAFDAEVNLARGADTVLDGHLDRVRRQLGDLAGLDPAAAQRRARTVVEAVALALQASLLVRFSPAAVADAFVDARLGPDRTHEYGTLAPAADLQAILKRA
ncbi:MULTISPECIES: acyl-CoA dehydrogenase family protein [unclassified Rhodococcus (in: high G+C Gram-positive bacteria)]|uniref:acyl-CoA dehydrogenase family protein n=1 Tax=unclassified Rhodococcus (in: high G+C Gram-positive bacteria) TaxID=192944 RepID=UPI0016398AFE|nr:MULTISPECIES: acyl-CoA dehydrogenase family protein [unclassified Rhodococcus (in: high G+C Gram-positive bacteria)]MBC2640916.1 acyl-CoA dehydrogenase family protein [Rhodococcus sp. 3A]MBC2894341.1 acyl-CoA dehydrogenase family protein [Rhodococcus sp. 4CII]